MKIQEKVWYAARFALGALAIMAIVVFYKISGISISIASGYIISKWIFYPITFCGIIGCIFICKVILVRISLIKSLMEILGKYSVDIMIVHLVVFRLAYGVWQKTNLEIQTISYEEFVFSHTAICLILGIAVPVFLRAGINYVINVTLDKIANVSIRKLA